ELEYRGTLADLLCNECPPHNTFLILWSQSGIAAVLAGAWFATLVVWLLVRQLWSDSQESKWRTAAALAVFGWILVQGMGENFGLFGDLRLQVVLAMALALAFAPSAVFYRGGGR